MLALTALLTRTRYGLEMRAAADNFTMERMLGVRANRVIMLAFAISGMLAAAIGLILATQSGIADIHIGGSVMLLALIPTVLLLRCGRLVRLLAALVSARRPATRS